MSCVLISFDAEVEVSDVVGGSTSGSGALGCERRVMNEASRIGFCARKPGVSGLSYKPAPNYPSDPLCIFLNAQLSYFKMLTHGKRLPHSEVAWLTLSGL